MHIPSETAKDFAHLQMLFIYHVVTAALCCSDIEFVGGWMDGVLQKELSVLTSSQRKSCIFNLDFSVPLRYKIYWYLDR